MEIIFKNNSESKVITILSPEDFKCKNIFICLIIKIDKDNKGIQKKVGN